MTTAPTPSSSDDAPAVLVETRPGVVRLTLNRPAKGNALGLTMAREVLAAIAAAEADDSVHVLTLTGAGRIFCGGGDVQAMAAAPAGPERRAMIQELGEAAGEVAVALTGSRLLVLAGVNGT
ncbi:enoyl-CoA hydratase/isomerase family protein, partial [Streptomyces sp. NPDC127092]|uniref:enoyl-CoA hydratase/isomerase family protein n=1 Tax=Streptomyces sp. NPDC127092 TaxID=3347135 RepID=UPI003665B656